MAKANASMQTKKPIYEVKTLGEFLWKTALYMRFGYVHYAFRTIPEGKDIKAVLTKLILHYDIYYNRAIRRQRKAKGKANVVLLYFNNQFLLLATEGKHREFEKIKSLTFTEKPLQFSGYSIGIKQGKPCIEISSRRIKGIRKTLKWLALKDSERVNRYLKEISPFTFKGISDQRWKLIKEVNQRRKKAGLKYIFM